MRLGAVRCNPMDTVALTPAALCSSHGRSVLSMWIRLAIRAAAPSTHGPRDSVR